jgi:hypothetical protein
MFHGWVWAGLWSIVSAPLVLGCNLNDSAVVDRVWPTVRAQQHGDFTLPVWL